MSKKTIDDINVKGLRVLVRVDFNVPMKDGKITNDKRIQAALPTIQKLIADGGKVILCSHLGKPKNGPEEKFSLAPVAVRLSELLGQPVVFANDDNVVGDEAKAAVETLAAVTAERDALQTAVENAKLAEKAQVLVLLQDETVLEADALGQLNLDQLPAGVYTVKVRILNAAGEQAAEYSFPYTAAEQEAPVAEEAAPETAEAEQPAAEAAETEQPAAEGAEEEPAAPEEADPDAQGQEVEVPQEPVPEEEAKDAA